MKGSRDPRAREQSATALGRMARVLDGSANRTDELAARERFLVAISTPPRVRGRWVVAAAALLVFGAAAEVVWLQRSESLDYRITGPLMAQGEWLAVASDASPVSLKFSEGTEIELGPGSKGRIADVSAEGARVVLASGQLRARVVPRPKAHWAVAAGPYVIEVTGTAFDVGWSAPKEQLELSLHDGSVIVRGPSLRGGVRVKAGQRLIADARTGSAELSSLFNPRPASHAEAVASSTPVEAPEKGPAPPAAPAAPSWSELVADGDFRAVLDAAQASGFEQSLNHGSLKDLIALSDAARYLGNRALARRGLLAQRSRYRSSAAARAAAFVLGRMADDAGSPNEALGWYETYLNESPGGSFAAEASGRRLVALVRLNNVQAARAAAESYLKRFPRGAHAAYAEELLRRP